MVCYKSESLNGLSRRIFVGRHCNYVNDEYNNATDRHYHFDIKDFTMKKLLTLSALACGVIAPTAMAAEEVNVYSYRQPFLVEPMFKEFTKETGIKVNVKFAKKV